MPKIKDGYYLKARIIQEKKISKAPPHIREIWDYLLMNANHKDNIYGGNIVTRGQLFRSYQDIRDGLSWNVGWRKMMYSENHTKKAMKFLRDTQMIATKKELGGVLITVLNYDYYQNPKNYERTKESTNERTVAEPLRNQPLPDTNKNVKNDKNKTYPDWLDLPLWKQYKIYRTKIKAPLTDHAEQLSLTALKEQIDAGFKQADIINATIESGKWKSFYPVKGKTGASIKSHYNFPECGSCGAKSSSIKKGTKCNYCGEIA